MGQLFVITKWTTVITKWDRLLYYKVGQFYYKVAGVLQSGTVLLPSGTGITKWGNYYKSIRNIGNILTMSQGFQRGSKCMSIFIANLTIPSSN